MKTKEMERTEIDGMDVASRKDLYETFKRKLKLEDGSPDFERIKKHMKNAIEQITGHGTKFFFERHRYHMFMKLYDTFAFPNDEPDIDIINKRYHDEIDIITTSLAD